MTGSNGPGAGSPAGAASDASRVPHSPQYFSPGPTTPPHPGQASARGLPHSTQKRRPGLFSVPHVEHFTRAVHLGCGGPERSPTALPVEGARSAPPLHHLLDHLLLPHNDLFEQEAIFVRIVVTGGSGKAGRWVVRARRVLGYEPVHRWPDHVVGS